MLVRFFAVSMLKAIHTEWKRKRKQIFSLILVVYSLIFCFRLVWIGPNTCRTHNGVSRPYVRMHILNVYLTTLIRTMNTEIEEIFMHRKTQATIVMSLTSVQVCDRQNRTISQWSWNNCKSFYTSGLHLLLKLNLAKKISFIYFHLVRQNIVFTHNIWFRHLFQLLLCNKCMSGQGKDTFVHHLYSFAGGRTTLGPAHIGFGYNEHQVITRRFLCIRIVYCSVKKFAYSVQTLIKSSLFCIILLVLNGIQCRKFS